MRGEGRGERRGGERRGLGNGEERGEKRRGESNESGLPMTK